MLGELVTLAIKIFLTLSVALSSREGKGQGQKYFNIFVVFQYGVYLPLLGSLISSLGSNLRGL